MIVTGFVFPWEFYTLTAFVRLLDTNIFFYIEFCTFNVNVNVNHKMFNVAKIA